jgi:hypothetical protein
VVARLEPGRRGKVSQKFTESLNFFRSNPASGKPLGLGSVENGQKWRFRTEMIEEADAMYRKD